jgi:hypothetical protein
LRHKKWQFSEFFHFKLQQLCDKNENKINEAFKYYFKKLFKIYTTKVKRKYHSGNLASAQFYMVANFLFFGSVDLLKFIKKAERRNLK